MGNESANRSIAIGLLGAGSVGSNVAAQLVAGHEDLAARAGANLVLKAVAVNDGKKPRPELETLSKAGVQVTTDAQALVNNPDIDVIIEVIGGIEPARTLILEALNSGKSVVTANKALLAQHGGELFEAAAKNNVDLYFEAAVAGAIPIIRPLRDSLAGDHVARVMGIVNGTTNYILSQMSSNGISFESALKELK